MTYSKRQFVAVLVGEANNGHLVTPKHDPSNVSSPEPGYRTIVLSDNPGMITLLQSEDFTVQEYHNNNSKHPPHFFVLTPNDPTFVTGSGIPPLSTTPTTACNVFVVVSGYNNGWHIYADEAANISSKITTSGLTFVADIT